ncbi:uncharacterized protein LOC119601633 [Lucilia sericata]|uniref:uncharacterized protein LOC119601633 n=1 Tax=Lucilia sericata TaxID=13632 RepID=UPI0018A805A0|nr:uncharacterized protein LOC119601633 [Lucilia sericata]
MGRFKIYDPKQMVRILKDPKYANCLLCEKKLKNVMGNIKRHYEQIHDMVISASGNKEDKKSQQIDVEYKPLNAVAKRREEEALPANNSNYKKIKVETKETQTNNIYSLQQTDANTYINNIEIAALDSCHQEELLKFFIETKTLLNIPLNKFQDGNTFQEALPAMKQNFKLKCNLKTVGEHIDQIACKLQQDISKIVDNRLLYLKLDTAIKEDSKVMLINIQFIKDFELKVFTLSALELPNDNVSPYLEKVIQTTLDYYQIDINQILSTTKDNAYVRDSLHINENVVENLPQKDATYIYPPTNEYCQHLCDRFPGHALHFAASDIIQQLNENISQSRDSVKRLRLQMPGLNLKPLPELDSSISWCSVYDMIKSLLNIRDQIENNMELMVEVDWTFVLKFEASFRPVVNTVIMLQTDKHFIMGDFYREWLMCELELEELATSNELALYLLESLRKRKEDLFQNKNFLAALYLDPRFCHADTIHFKNKQKKTAIAELLQIFNQLKSVENNQNVSSLCTKFTDRYEKLERNILEKMEMPTVYPPASLNIMDGQWLNEALEKLQFHERLPFNANILDYWKVVKYKNPILAKIAEIALAAPATQVTINRALNAWPLTFMKRNTNLSSTNIENILLLKLNQDLVDKILLQT